MLLLCHFTSGFWRRVSAAAFLSLLRLRPSPSSLPVSLRASFFMRASSLGNPGLCCLDVVVRLPTSKNTASVGVAFRPAGILPAGQSRISPGGTFYIATAADEGRKKGRKLDFTRCHWVLLHLPPTCVFFH